MACAELHKEQAGLPVHAPSDDFAVKHLKLVLELMRNRDIPASLVEATLGTVARLVRWYEDEKDTRFFLEAMLLGRANDKYIQQQLGENVLPPMLRLYRLWFFDIEDHLTNRMWIESRVLRPALYGAQSERASLKRGRLHVAHLWKTLGYYGGCKRLDQALSSGMVYDSLTAQWLRRFCTSKNTRSIMGSMEDPGHDEFGLQQHAQVHSWGADEVSADREAGNADDKDEDKVTKAITRGLNTAKPDGKVSKIERIAAPTYTEEDLPNAR